MPSSEARRRFGDFTRGVPRCSDERIYRSRNRPMKRGRRQEPRTHHQINAWHIKLRILAFPAAVLLRSAIREAKQQNPPSIHPVDGMVDAAVTVRREQCRVSKKEPRSPHGWALSRPYEGKHFSVSAYFFHTRGTCQGRTLDDLLRRGLSRDALPNAKPS